MSVKEEITRQREFWDGEMDAFDAIYSRRKGGLGRLLDTVFRWDMHERFNYAMENSMPIGGRAFLDVGCGTGRYSLELARRGARKITGIDISGEMIGACRRRALAEGLHAVCSFIQTDLLQHGACPGHDVCIGIGLFDYIKDPLPVLERMRESVADRAVMSFPVAWTWRAAARKVRLGIRGCGVYFYSRAQIAGLLDRAGFKRYNMKRIGQLYCVTAFIE